MLSNQSRYGLILAALAVAVLIWLIETLLHVFLFKSGDFLNQLIPANPNELWMRAIITLLICGFGFYAQMMFNNNLRQLKKVKQAEAELARSNLDLEATTNLLSRIIESIPVRVFWKDREFRFLGCNRLFARDAGCLDPEDLVGKTDYQMAWKSQADLYRADETAVIESNAPKLGFEEPQTTPEGKTVWLRASKVPLRSSSGEILGILGIYDDITEQKNINQMFQTMIESMAGVSGREFFRNTVRSLCTFLGAECAIVSEVERGHVRALAMQADGSFVNGFEYDLSGTPCGKAAADGFSFYPERVWELFPDDEDLVRMGAEAYVGMPIRDRWGKCIGILCAISRHKMELPERTEDLFDIIAAKAASEIEGRRIMEKRAELLNQNRYLARKLLAAQEMERRKMARDLHDEIGQALAALKAHGAMARKHSRGGKARQQLDQMEEVVDHMFSIVRSMLESLQPTSIDELGLQKALTKMVAAWQIRNGIECSCQIDEGVDYLDYEVAITCYRIVQEALTNIAKHAGAHRASIAVGLKKFEESKDFALHLEVSDDGCGIGEVQFGMGLTGMRERIQALGGEFLLDRPDENGTRITARIPLFRDSDA